VKKVLLLGLFAACGGSSSSSSSHKHTYKMSELPAGAFLGGLPASGTGTVTVDLSEDLATVKDWTKVTGTIDAACGDCQIGDDHTRLQVGRGRTAFDGGSISFSHIAWDSLTAHVDIKDGALHAVGHARGDVDLDVEITATLQPSLAATPVDGCFAYRQNDRLRARDELLANAIELTGAPRGADRRNFIALRGTFGDLRRIPSVCEVAAR
jgi:hypothetical protein